MLEHKKGELPSNASSTGGLEGISQACLHRVYRQRHPGSDNCARPKFSLYLKKNHPNHTMEFKFLDHFCLFFCVDSYYLVLIHKCLSFFSIGVKLHDHLCSETEGHASV